MQRIWQLTILLISLPRGLPRGQNYGGNLRGRSVALPIGQARGMKNTPQSNQFILNFERLNNALNNPTKHYS